MKINKLEIENVKRVRALSLEPAASGLTVIGGKNGVGKTSVLDAIAWALGGDKYRPANAAREGSVIPPNLRVELSNGIIVERKGKNSALTVTDPECARAGQQLLDAFVEKLALDLPKFLQQSNREKADTLLRIIGVEAQLTKLRGQESKLYNQRRAIGQIADQKEKYAQEMPSYPAAPEDLVSVSELIQRQQTILARNGENQRKRQNARALEDKWNLLQGKIDGLYATLAQLIDEQKVVRNDLDTAKKTAEQLQDESTGELEVSIRRVEEINLQVRTNLDKERAIEEAQVQRAEYNSLSAELDKTRKAALDLLAGADLPLPELSVNDAGELTYRGFTWGDMSSAEQLRVATAIIRKLNPQCEFVLIDKLEAMDVDTLREFGAWLEAQGLQAICTRVSTGSECSILIEDGMEQGIAEKAKTWEEGKF